MKKLKELQTREDLALYLAIPLQKLTYILYKSKPDSYYDTFEFAYAITVHLSQGSQYDNVFYFKERMGFSDFSRKLDYTAITRAKHGLIIAVDDEEVRMV